jgi:asparagine synthase (glutamine-hydrolysing)
MSGIAGVLKKSENNYDIQEILKIIRHRGPDNQNIFETKNFIGGVNSSILSKERGTGISKDNKTVVLFDGEIYNQHSENQSDADVVLSLYKKLGMSFTGYLDGLFAFALWNGKELLLVRGPVGVRPLYYGKNSQGDLFFGSELKTLIGKVEEVEELKPSTIYSSLNGLSAYLTQYPSIDVPDNVESAKKLLKDYLIEATKKRIDDGAVKGMLLSGGLDSSIIASIVREFDSTIPVFTVGIEGAPAPDIENAKLFADYFGFKHYIYKFKVEEIVDMVPKAVWHLESFDEDCISGTIANLNASKLAAEHTNCILSGEGADELFGGYHLIKDLKTEYDKILMMNRLVDIAYNTAVQRLDRSMMGNSLNYRTPFLDLKVIALAKQLPVSWKLKKVSSNQYIEKWILREAFKNMLPKEIYSRVKLRFSGGTGTDSVMDNIAKTKLSETEFNENSRKTLGGYYLNSPKELWYYKIFKNYFPDLSFEKIVGRWDPFK